MPLLESLKVQVVDNGPDPSGTLPLSMTTMYFSLGRLSKVSFSFRGSVVEIYLRGNRLIHL